MSFDWTEYLNLAGELLTIPFSPSSTEAKQRSAMSRAYYAAFGKARVHLRDNDRDPNIPGGPQVHRYVRQAFLRSPNRIRRRVGHNLNQLRLHRNRADHDDVVSGLPQRSTIAVMLADQVIGDLTTV